MVAFKLVSLAKLAGTFNRAIVGRYPGKFPQKDLRSNATAIYPDGA